MDALKDEPQKDGFNREWRFFEGATKLSSCSVVKDMVSIANGDSLRELPEYAKPINHGTGSFNREWRFFEGATNGGNNVQAI